jgi:PAS domain-containing protein
MSEGILEINSEGKILYANPAVLSFVAMPEEELSASYFVELFSKEDRRRTGDLLDM